MLTPASPVLARPAYSSISLGGYPAAATRLGSRISSGTIASIPHDTASFAPPASSAHAAFRAVTSCLLAASHDPQYGDDLAHDLGSASGDRCVGRIMRHQPVLAVRGLLECLNRGLAFNALDQCRHDIAAGDAVLLADDHEVAVADARVHHGVASHPEHEQGSVADDLPGQQEFVFDLFLG